MGFTIPTAPAPGKCACGAAALHGWEGHMSWPDLVYVYCPVCKKRGPTVSNPGRRKWPVQSETRAVELWNAMQTSEAFNAHAGSCQTCGKSGFCVEGMDALRAATEVDS